MDGIIEYLPKSADAQRGAYAGLDLLIWLAAVWAMVPPLWFWVEYWWIYLRQPRHLRGDADAFKHGQQVSAAIWAALLVVQLTVLSALL